MESAVLAAEIDFFELCPGSGIELRTLASDFTGCIHAWSAIDSLLFSLELFKFILQIVDSY